MLKAILFVAFKFSPNSAHLVMLIINEDYFFPISREMS